MKNTEKIRILTEMRELIESGREQFMCHAYARVRGLSKHEITDAMMNEVGLFDPKVSGNWITIGSWYHPNDKATRLQKIDEAINKFNNTMNKNEIKSEIQSIEESMKKDAERLNALRLEMDKPEKPTLEEMCEDKDTYYIDSEDGKIEECYEYDYTNYLSRERAEKEKLRIKLSVIADYLNQGLFEPKTNERGYYIYITNGNAEIGETTGDYSYGFILFKTREHTELAMTYFTEEQLNLMLR